MDFLCDLNVRTHPVLAAGDAPVQETVLEHPMSGFDSPRLELAGLQQAEPIQEAWKRFAVATLMAGAALLLCAIIVVILAPLLPHASSVSHAALLTLPAPATPARV
jgi:hypothetical protein